MSNAIICSIDILTADAIATVRDLLMKHGEAPVAAFIDDHVANIIIDRNDLRARVMTLEAALQKIANIKGPLIRREYVQEIAISALGKTS